MMRISKRRVLGTLLVCAAVLALSSCALLQGVGGFQRPKMRFKQLHLRDVSLGQMTLDFEFEVENANAVGLNLASIGYQLDIDGKMLLKGKSGDGVKIAPKATSPLMLPLTVEFVELAESIYALLSAKDKVAYRVQAGFGIETPVGVITLPMDVKGDVPLPSLPKISVAGVALKRLDLTGASVEFRIDVANQGSFPLKVSGLGYSISVANVDVASGRAEVAEVAAGQSVPVVVPLGLNFFKVGRAVVKIVRRKQLPYRLTGELDLGLFKQPFALEGTSQL